MIARTEKFWRRLRSLPSETGGMALTEFAFTAPILLSLGLVGTETASFVVTHMKVSQIAMQVADNGSRIGEHDVLVSRKVYEDHVNDMFVGADKLAGDLKLFEHGRIVVSSLEQNSDGGQWIHWQRCRGKKNSNSSYGTEGTGSSGTGFAGMGETGKEITASAGTAVIFVEIFYDYQPITPITNNMTGTTIRYTAAFNVRDARDLTQIYNNGGTVWNCSQFTA